MVLKLAYIFIICFCLFSCTSEEQRIISNGKDLYKTNCKSCHGLDGKKQFLGSSDLSISTMKNDSIVFQIEKGGNGMPAFEELLNKKELSAVSKFIITLRDQ